MRHPVYIFKCHKSEKIELHPPELVVDLLVKHQDSPVHVIHPDEVGPSQVIFNEADDTTCPLVPPVVMPRPLTPVHLGYSGC